MTSNFDLPSNQLSAGCSSLIVVFAFLVAFGFWNIFIAPAYDEVEINATDKLTELEISRSWFRLGSPSAIEFEVVGETTCNIKLVFVHQITLFKKEKFDNKSDVYITPDDLNKALRFDFYEGSTAKIVYEADSCMSQQKRN